MRLEPGDLLSQPVRLGEIDLHADNPALFSWKASLSASRAGLLHGVAGWFEGELAEGVWMTNSPVAERPIQRPQAFLPIGEVIAVNAGEEIAVTVMARPRDEVTAWVVETSSGRTCRHSTWRGLPLSPADIARADPARVRHPTRDARARMTVLDYCDGRRTAHEIEQEATADHPDLFPSPEETSRFVAQVLSRTLTSGRVPRGGHTRTIAAREPPVSPVEVPRRRAVGRVPPDWPRLPPSLPRSCGLPGVGRRTRGALPRGARRVRRDYPAPLRQAGASAGSQPTGQAGVPRERGEIEDGGVVFIGDSGRGKSTLAASFATNGYRFLTDDGLVIEEGDEGYLVLPSQPSIRLWEDSREALLHPRTPAAAAVEHTPKACFLAGNEIAFCKESRPLRLVRTSGEWQCGGS